MIAALTLSLLTLAAPEPRRLAVIVGSNTAVDGRPSLRYSHRDAKSIADVLTSAGRFDSADVAVLLDPKPDEVLKALDDKLTVAKAAGPKSLLVFYYSGHADSHALFPGGAALPMDALKTRLSSDSAGLRVGIIDACRGGGWTAAKGLTPAEPFEVGLPQLSSEGTVLLAASSGLEDAHEAESLQGSFFTHHLVAGLRGAADTSHDAQVSLEEAFNYANKMTIRDTAMIAKEPQHPSFDMRLHGRQEIVLTDATSAPSVLTVDQQTGPLQIVQLSSGDVVVEQPAGANVFRLALPPGDYLVRKVDGAQVKVRQVTVAVGEKTTIGEASLQLIGQPQLADKGIEETAAVEEKARLAPSIGLDFVPDFSGFYTSAGVNAGFTYRFNQHFSIRARASYLFTMASSLSDQLSRDFGVQSSSITPVVQAQGEAYFVYTPLHSELSAVATMIDVSFGGGPNGAVLRSLPLTGTTQTTSGPVHFGFGPSLFSELGFTLPHHPEMWVRLSVASDMFFNDARKPGAWDQGTVINFRLGLGFAYFFGGA
ncbi:MAG: caspase family protein [Myxococcaceae bacterium]